MFSDSRIKSAFNGLCIQPWWLGGRAVAAHSVVSTVSTTVGLNTEYGISIVQRRKLLVAPHNKAERLAV